MGVCIPWGREGEERAYLGEGEGVKGVGHTLGREGEVRVGDMYSLGEGGGCGVYTLLSTWGSAALVASV